MDTVAEIKKNSRELIKVSLGNFKGHPVCDLRCCYEAKPGEWLPGPKGLTFSTSLLPEIIEALKAASESLEVPHDKA